MQDKRQEELERMYGILLKCHLETRKSKRKTNDEHVFEMNLFENLMNIAVSIVDFVYVPSPGIAFVTRKPVMREIFAAPYRDRVVHHYIYSRVINYWERQFIYDSYSCRKYKGTLKGIRRVEKFVRSATRNNSQAVWVYKYDLSGYFMSLPRKKLYGAAVSGLDRQYKNHKNYDYRYLKYLWGKIIFNDPTVGVELRGDVNGWVNLPKTKSLFYQPKGYGIVIGNLTSQLLSNIYLNDFDHYMKEWLGFRYYARYVDDFLVLVPEDERHKMTEAEMLFKKFLERKNLKVNNRKTYRQSVEKGIQFLGVVIYPGRTVMGPRVKKNMKIIVQEYKLGYKSVDSLISYAGIARHHCCANLVTKMLDEAEVT